MCINEEADRPADSSVSLVRGVPYKEEDLFEGCLSYILMTRSLVSVFFFKRKCFVYNND